VRQWVLFDLREALGVCESGARSITAAIEHEVRSL